MKKLIVCLVFLPCSIFCSLLQIEKEIKIEIKNNLIEYSKKQKYSIEEQWYLLGKSEGLFIALEMIERENLQ